MTGYGSAGFYKAQRGWNGMLNRSLGAPFIVVMSTCLLAPNDTVSQE